MNARGTSTAISLAGLLGLWIVAAALGADAQVLPQPWDLPFAREFLNGELLYHVTYTLCRVLVAFALAMSLGLALGLLMGTNPALDRLLDPWLVVFLNLPALVVIVLCYLWIGLNEWAAILAVTLNKVPNVVTVTREGARALSPQLRDLAQVYEMPWSKQMRHIILPQMTPFIAGAARSGIAIIWKIVLVVEFLGRSNGVGFQIHLYFQLFDVASVLVYAISFIAVMLLIEWLFLQPMERRANRWRAA